MLKMQSYFALLAGALAVSAVLAQGSDSTPSAAFSAERVALIVMKNETVKLLKKACDSKFDQFKEQNEAAYRDSPFSKIESESAIDFYVAPERKATFISALENTRQSTAGDFLRMGDEALRLRCEAFPQMVIKLSK